MKSAGFPCGSVTSVCGAEKHANDYHFKHSEEYFCRKLMISVFCVFHINSRSSAKIIILVIFMDFKLFRPERTLRDHEKAKELLLFSHPGRPAGPKARISPEITEITWKSAKITFYKKHVKIP